MVVFLSDGDIKTCILPRGSNTVAKQKKQVLLTRGRKSCCSSTNMDGSASDDDGEPNLGENNTTVITSIGFENTLMLSLLTEQWGPKRKAPAGGWPSPLDRHPRLFPPWAQPGGSRPCLILCRMTRMWVDFEAASRSKDLALKTLREVAGGASGRWSSVFSGSASRQVHKKSPHSRCAKDSDSTVVGGLCA